MANDSRSWHRRQLLRLSYCDASGGSKTSCKAGFYVTRGVATRYPSDCESSLGWVDHAFQPDISEHSFGKITNLCR